MDTEPDLAVYSSGKSANPEKSTALKELESTGVLPPFLLKTIAEEDKRLPRNELGLGVVVGQEARFYPKKTVATDSLVEDSLGGKAIRVSIQKSGHLKGTEKNG